MAVRRMAVRGSSTHYLAWPGGRTSSEIGRALERPGEVAQLFIEHVPAHLVLYPCGRRNCIEARPWRCPRALLADEGGSRPAFFRYTTLKKRKQNEFVAKMAQEKIKTRSRIFHQS